MIKSAVQSRAINKVNASRIRSSIINLLEDERISESSDLIKELDHKVQMISDKIK